MPASWRRCARSRKAKAPARSQSRCGLAPSPRTNRRLPQRREGRRDQDLVLLADRSHAALRRPRPARRTRCRADALALVEILVDPGVDELVEPAELAGPAGD